MGTLKIGLIGGSGLGQALAGSEGVRHEVATPFGSPSGAIVEVEWDGVPVFVLSRHGEGHTLNPGKVPYRANIFALKTLGVTHILASGAVGSLREEFRPRDLVIPDQVIDKTQGRVGTFFEQAAVHVEFAEPFCPVLRRMLLEVGRELAGGGQSAVGGNEEQRHLHRVYDRGCYVAMEGPAFSTRAESIMHRLWGGDLIGMTAMPEAKLAREAEIAYGLVAMVTDYDCWRNKPVTSKETGSESATRTDAHELLKEIIANLQAATQNAVALMKRTVELMSQRQDELATSPALKALELAIWSEKSRIDPSEVQRLAPLWMKYFG